MDYCCFETSLDFIDRHDDFESFYVIFNANKLSGFKKTLFIVNSTQHICDFIKTNIVVLSIAVN